jgi:hypothetical protein
MPPSLKLSNHANARVGMLLEQINHHLEQNSIIVSLGSINIIDAAVIEAKQSRE